MTIKEFSEKQRADENFWKQITPEEVLEFKRSFRDWFLQEFECSKMSYMHFRDRILHKSASFNSWFDTKQQRALANIDRFGKDMPNRRDFDSWKELIEERNENVKLITSPENSNALFRCQCLKCSSEFETHLLIGPYIWGTIRKCPHCFGNRTVLEKKISDLLTKVGISSCHLNRDARFDGTFMENKEIDIYVQSLKIGFEINGALTHNSGFNPFGKKPKSKNYHQKKTQVCLEKGIRLYHIWEHWDEKKIESLIRAKVGKPEECFQARKLAVVSVSTEKEKEFLEANHLEGYTFSIKNFALVSEDEIVQLVSLRQNKDSLEIARIATKLNTSVVGGSERLFKHVKKFAEEQGFRTILSYAYRDLTPSESASVYTRLGFICEGDKGPMLSFYSFRNVKNKEGRTIFRQNEVINRIRLQKFKLKNLEGSYVYKDKPFIFDSSLTAEQNLAKLQIYPVYNSGCWKFVYYIK